MPNRILKETICTSDNLDHLSMGAEVFFYRLLVRCDDFGRMDARCSILRAACFPLRLDEITDEQMAGWLKELVSAGLLWIYAVDSHSYLQITKWDKHQQKRAKFSKYPQPPDDASACNQLISDASNSLREARDEKREARDEKREVFGADAPTPEPEVESSSKPSEQKDQKSRQRDPLFDAVADVTASNPKLLGSRIAKCTNQLRKIGATPELVRQVATWYSANDWRGKKGEKLTFALLAEVWDSGIANKPVMVTNNGHGERDEPAGFRAIREAMNDPRWNGK